MLLQLELPVLLRLLVMLIGRPHIQLRAVAANARPMRQLWRHSPSSASSAQLHGLLPHQDCAAPPPQPMLPVPGC